MKRLKWLGLAVVAMFALTAVLSATAFALPELLGWATGEEYSGKNTVANPTLETVAKEKIECKAATASGKQTSDTLGTFNIDFTGCKAITILGNFACNSTGDAKEVILSKGINHYVFDHLGTGAELGVAILFLPEEVTIECTALVKLKVRGDLVCLVTSPLTESVTHEFKCVQTGGKQSETSFFNDEGKAVTAHLETSKNGGAFEESGEQATASFTFTKAVVFMND